MSKITLTTNDNIEIITNTHVIKCCDTLNTMLKYCKTDEENKNCIDVIPLLNISSDILTLILQWSEFHQNDQLVEIDEINNNNNIIPIWDYNFLNMNSDVIFELLNASNYLNIKKLSDYIYKIIVNRIACMKEKELKEVFNDFDADDNGYDTDIVIDNNLDDGYDTDTIIDNNLDNSLEFDINFINNLDEYF